MAMKKIKEETQPVPRKVRGVLTALGGDSFEFKPYKEGESTQQNVVTVGKSKMYDTVGKTPQRVVHLIVPKDTADVRAELFRQVDCLTQGDKTEAELPPQQSEEMVCILKGEHVKMYVDERQRLLRMYHEIPIALGANYSGEMMRCMMACNQSLAVNRDKLSAIEKIVNKS
jgi:hypothetical protein